MRIALGFAAVAILVAGCGESLSPEEEIELLRSEYNAELTSWTVNQEPVEEPAPEGEATAPDDDGEPPAAPEVATEVMLDILVSSDVDSGLDGVTLDLTHVDGDMNEKDRRTLWIETKSLTRGIGSQTTHVLSDLDYEVGDMFHVEVRVPIPPEERSGYREFQSP